MQHEQRTCKTNPCGHIGRSDSMVQSCSNGFKQFKCSVTFVMQTVDGCRCNRNSCVVDFWQRLQVLESKWGEEGAPPWKTWNNLLKFSQCITRTLKTKKMFSQTETTYLGDVNPSFNDASFITPGNQSTNSVWRITIFCLCLFFQKHLWNTFHC